MTCNHDNSVRFRAGAQNIGLITLCMDGSKHPIDYGVMVHRKIKYENGSYPLKKLTPGLRFKSFLISLVLTQRGFCQPEHDSEVQIEGGLESKIL
jgi:hypothetical protein